MSDLHARPLKLRDLPELEPKAIDFAPRPNPTERPRVYSSHSRWSGRIAWHWNMIHPLWPNATVSHGPFWSVGEAMDDARKYLRNRAWS